MKLNINIVYLLGVLVGLAQSFQPVSHFGKTTTKIQTHLEAVSGDDPSVGRRGVLGAGMASLMTLLLGDKAIAATSEPQTILITGANSGVGYFATKRLAAQGHTVILACRTLEKANSAIEKVRADVTTGTLVPAECNLASLESIRSFAKDLKAETLDVVCLNAAVSLNTEDKNVQRTADGFELTVGVNHLGHTYLNNLLLPKVNRNGGRIVVTASAVHDPDTLGGQQGKTATLGDLEGFERDGKNFEMVDGNPYNGDKAYKDSKLCNVMFTRELQKRLSADSTTKGISVNCFSPGLVPRTGLFRNQNPLLSMTFSVFAEGVIKFAETPEWAGASLAYMTTVDSKGQYWNSAPGSSKFGDAAFGREFTTFEPSKESQDDTKAKKLWELTDKLLKSA